jgi:BirA family transcriptional regulator, biotin operon repressor / biotin---[acetyl-CoA-carboxylase] ligase
LSAFELERVASALVPGEMRWSLHYEPACESTQDLALAAAAEGVPQGWVVVTDQQRAGRGRQGRPWVAPKQAALLFSIVLQPPVDVIPLLPLLAGVAVAGGIELQTGAVPDLKWPNDVLLNRDKLAGILLERPAGPAVILGVGLNVNVLKEDLPEGGTSLAVALGHTLDREPMLAAILNDLGNAYERADREGTGWIVPAWRSRSTMLSHPVTFTRDGRAVRGIAEDVGEDGALLVRLQDGTRVPVVAGEVQFVRSG